jgi:hypothetical protein
MLFSKGKKDNFFNVLKNPWKNAERFHARLGRPSTLSSLVPAKNNMARKQMLIKAEKPLFLI